MSGSGTNNNLLNDGRSMHEVDADLAQIGIRVDGVDVDRLVSILTNSEASMTSNDFNVNFNNHVNFNVSSSSVNSHNHSSSLAPKNTHPHSFIGGEGGDVDLNDVNSSVPAHVSHDVDGFGQNISARPGPSNSLSFSEVVIPAVRPVFNSPMVNDLADGNSMISDVSDIDELATKCKVIFPSQRSGIVHFNTNLHLLNEPNLSSFNDSRDFNVFTDFK